MAKRGPKPKYKPEYDKQAYVACTKGMIDLDLAELFGICEKTLYNWQEKHESFRNSIQAGKDIYNCDIAERSLKKLIEGYDYQEAKIITDAIGNPIRKEMTKKHVSPNPGSICFFLKNRMPERWRDIKAVELSAPDGKGLFDDGIKILGDSDNPIKFKIDLLSLSDEELKAIESIVTKTSGKPANPDRD